MLIAVHWFLVTLGGTVGLSIFAGVIWLAKLGTEKILNHYLEKRLADFKHEQSQEIEQLRSQLSHLHDRAIRSNEQEYQALTVVWESFIDAYHSTFGAIGGLRTRPELKKMSLEDIREWLDAMNYDVMAKKFITEAYDKDAALSRVDRSKELSDCQNALWEAQKILRHKSVFIPHELEQKFNDGLAIMRYVWSENQVNFGTPGSLPLTKTIEFLEKEERGSGLRADLSNLTRIRLLHSERVHTETVV